MLLRSTEIHIESTRLSIKPFSANDAVYKVQGQPEVIPRFYPEMAEDDPVLRSTFAAHCGEEVSFAAERSVDRSAAQT